MNVKKILLSAMMMLSVSALMPVAQMDSVNALPPITEAGHSIGNEFRRFASEDQVIEWKNAVSPSWVTSLSEEEKGSIHFYTQSSQSINESLRQGNRDEDCWEIISDAVSNGLQKFNLSKGIVVYRGIHMPVWEELEPSHLIGAVITDNAFVSTSLLNGSFPGNVQVELYVPAGHCGAAIMSLSQFPDECEFLLDKGTNYVIREARKENDIIKVIAEVLPRGN
ncbi:ADP-ribosyltransferase [Paenibacillus popilliae]|uniref:NAD+--asparagine ADP-ribosyltransferase n=1 Tax=Paenibacillus popilliae ATCC 14706 TaxID=1212764 RepID=M9M5D5_PAEPP|nr:ADP-ribosyltransferase [Paenibacillus popilliae]GAC42553.1 NAD+--asparagine ADP-ribosyltransferase [Paenibacillus popilliae ATCC 14706]